MCETENNRLHTNNKKHVYKERKETTHERAGERKTYINIIEETISMSINGHKTSCTRTMYLRKKEKKRYIISSLHPLKRKTTLPLTQ